MKVKTMDKKENERASQEAYAYTPGLKVKHVENVVKERRLPLLGEVLVKEGDRVFYDTVVAKSTVPGDPYIVKATSILGVEPDELRGYALKKEGDHTQKDEIIARYVTLFGLLKKLVYSPIEGTIETVSEVSGQIVVRPPPNPIAIRAYIPGKVVKVIPNEGVLVETKASFIQGIFGIGGETQGMIKVLVSKPEEVLTVDKISSEHEGCVVVGGSQVTLDALKKAVEVGASGVVAGGISYDDVINFMGQTIGVAITGQEELGLTLIITEGIGKINMSRRTFSLLKQFEGHVVSMNGATQIRAGVIRPEIIKPLDKDEEEAYSEELLGGMKIGTPVRIIRDPYFGLIGKVAGLPVELQKIKTESYVRVLEVELEDGRRVTVPRANVEIIEE